MLLNFSLEFMNQLGTLYIVATPLGHLQDMSLRAVDILQTVQLIAAEDTRHSLPLLQHYSIKTPIISLHNYNEKERIDQLQTKLQKGESIALISDAGTPLISDPGFLLVKKMRETGIKIVPIPGACAAISALCVSGLPTDRFIFEGFLPQRASLRQARLSALIHETGTMIFYEAPHRILTFLQELQTIFGEKRSAVIARELTKLFETVLTGTLQELYETVKKDTNQQKGEIVILVAGKAKNNEEEIDAEIKRVLRILLTNCPLRQAVEMAAKLTSFKKNRIYDIALQM